MKNNNKDYQEHFGYSNWWKLMWDLLFHRKTTISKVLNRRNHAVEKMKVELGDEYEDKLRYMEECESMKGFVTSTDFTSNPFIGFSMKNPISYKEPFDSSSTSHFEEEVYTLRRVDAHSRIYGDFHFTQESHFKDQIAKQLADHLIKERLIDFKFEQGLISAYLKTYIRK